ncbi:MAG: bifunctional riboflavin kinase/FAD synthetase [Candidatus Zixiibacteriota bacterium]
MRILHPRQTLQIKSAITIGTFDGVHLGHKAIFQKVQDISRNKDLASVMITFEPPPKRFFSKGNIENLTTLSEKIDIISNIGIDYLLVLPFNKELVNTSWKKFVRKILEEKLNIKYLVVGYDFRMGKDKEGSPEKLLNMPFYVNIVSPFRIGKEPVKSSFIRDLVKKGEIKKANCFLGYNYNISGNTVKGLGLARKLGYPTINFRPSPEKLLPPNGVYAIESRESHKAGMLYIGNRPTFDINDKTIEVHFIDDIVDFDFKTISIEILEKIRDEKKFANRNELISQLAIDKERTIALIRKENWND